MVTFHSRLVSNSSACKWRKQIYCGTFHYLGYNNCVVYMQIWLMAGAGISYKKEYLRINCTCPASTCSIFHTLYEPKFQVALTHCNWTGGLLPVNASSYILGASIQPLAWLCVGRSGLVRVYQACAVFLMNAHLSLAPSISFLPQLGDPRSRRLSPPAPPCQRRRCRTKWSVRFT